MSDRSQETPDDSVDLQRRAALQTSKSILVLQRRAEEEILLAKQALEERTTELAARNDQLIRLNRELEETNRGVMALYAELDEKASAIRHAGELKSRFLSNMSHEFRTPTSSILGLTGLLLSRIDGELTAEQEKQIGYVRQSAVTLLELINDLLDLAKIEAGKSAVRPADFNVSDLFGSLRGMFRPLAINPETEFVIEEPSSPILVHTDEGKVSQILRNLIANALKFTEKGEIHVRAIPSADQNSIAFSVRDTGIGIDERHHERIFQEFGQIDSPLQRKVKGTGLGLALSRQIATLLGGTLTVTSQPDAGSTFVLTIPKKFDARPDGSAPQTAFDADVTRQPVLIIEDNEQTLHLYKKYLKSTNFRVVGAMDLTSARNLLTTVRPVAIILDILLPEEDGWGFLSELKMNVQTRDIPVFVASILDESDKGMALGADDYCIKPVERSWLIKKLGALAKHVSVTTALIIDDEEIPRYILKGHLAGTGVRVIEAASGEEGFRLAKLEKPSVIFLDLVMPDSTGFEVLDWLKTDAKTADIPVIINTSKSLDEPERQRLLTKTSAILKKETRTREDVVASLALSLGRLTRSNT